MITIYKLQLRDISDLHHSVICRSHNRTGDNQTMVGLCQRYVETDIHFSASRTKM